METELPKKSDDAPVALYGHCETVYNRLLAEAKNVVQDDGHTIVMWEGMLTKLIIQKLYFSTPNYTNIIRALKRMGCIRQLKRGGSSGMSQWEIIKEPTHEAFLNGLPPKVQDTSRYALLQGQVNALNKRVTAIENIIKNLFEEEQQKQIRARTSELDS